MLVPSPTTCCMLASIVDQEYEPRSLGCRTWMQTDTLVPDACALMVISQSRGQIGFTSWERHLGIGKGMFLRGEWGRDIFHGTCSSRADPAPWPLSQPEPYKGTGVPAGGEDKWATLASSSHSLLEWRAAENRAMSSLQIPSGAKSPLHPTSPWPWSPQPEAS